jgi:hypothetical protein
MKEWMNEMVEIMRGVKRDQQAEQSQQGKQDPIPQTGAHSPPRNHSNRKNPSTTPERNKPPQHLFHENGSQSDMIPGNNYSTHSYAHYPPLPYHNGYPYQLGQPTPPTHYHQLPYQQQPIYTQPMLTQDPAQVQDMDEGPSTRLPAAGAQM